MICRILDALLDWLRLLRALIAPDPQLADIYTTIRAHR